MINPTCPVCRLPVRPRHVLAQGIRAIAIAHRAAVEQLDTPYWRRDAATALGHLDTATRAIGSVEGCACAVDRDFADELRQQLQVILSNAENAENAHVAMGIDTEIRAIARAVEKCVEIATAIRAATLPHSPCACCGASGATRRPGRLSLCGTCLAGCPRCVGTAAPPPIVGDGFSISAASERTDDMAGYRR